MGGCQNEKCSYRGTSYKIMGKTCCGQSKRNSKEHKTIVPFGNESFFVQNSVQDS